MMRRKITSLSFVVVFCMSAVFAIVHANGGEDVLDVSAQEEPPANRRSGLVARADGTTQTQTSSMSSGTSAGTTHYRSYVGYSSIGVGASLIRGLSEIESFINPSSDLNLPSWYPMQQLGIGLTASTETALAASLNWRLRSQLPTNYESYVSLGLGMTFGILGTEPIAAYAGYQYENWLFEVGYSLGGDSYDEFEWDGSLFLRAGMEFDRIREPKVRDGNRVRYFRPGIELNYPVSRSDVEFWDDESLPIVLSGGLFFRIGPEPIYFTTGAYLKAEEREKEFPVGMPVSIMGIPIGSIPLVDLTIGYINWSVEVPLLLNYRLAKQVRFTGGALLDFNVDNWFYVDITSPWLGDDSFAWQFEDQLNDMISEHAPSGNLYWAIGVDFDILKNWGIGVKYIIHNSTFGGTDEFKEYFEPSQHQVRLSTYFVF